MDLILLGPPGAGKGTQAQLIEQQLGLAHVSSGDLFRAAIKQGTQLGLQAQAYIDRGALVPDALVIRLIIERVLQPDCAGGVLFDGFPRTEAQAAALDAALARYGRTIDTVIFLDVPNDTLLKRLTGRQICGACGAIHNIYFSPPRRAGICDTCGDLLYQRSDDTVDTARKRLDVYFAQTLPLVEYYRAHGKLLEVDGCRPIEQVTEQLLEALTLDALEVGG